MNFIIIKKIFLCILLFLFLAFNDSCTARPNKDENDWPLSTLTKKLWGCCFETQPEEEDEGQGLVPIRIEEKLEGIPLEILHLICLKLPPLDVVHLSMTTTNAGVSNDDRFWENYIKVHQRKRWTRDISAIKVAFSYAFFEQGNIHKAATLGLPIAKETLLKNEKEKKKKIFLSHDFTNMAIAPY